MIHPDTDGRRILVRERHAALARDAEQASPSRHADEGGARRAARRHAAPRWFLVLRLTGRRP